MTDDDDDLKINTLHRFAKASPRLVLHEYSHCEVPAGCGGVVLRWVDPRLGEPATVRVSADETAEVWLDGDPLENARTQLAPGAHVVAVHGRDVQVTVLLDDGDEGVEIPLATRFATHDPGPGWQAVGFDDLSWGTGEPAGEAWLRVAFVVPG